MSELGLLILAANALRAKDDASGAPVEGAERDMAIALTIARDELRDVAKAFEQAALACEHRARLLAPFYGREVA